MFNNIHVPLWLTLSKETREHLVKVFGIIPTGIKEIRDQSIISDGFTNENLQVISLEKMAEYTSSPISVGFHRLWEITLAKTRFELNPPIDPAILGIPPNPDSKVRVPFCDKCDSKGGRHKKVCPKK